MLDQDFKKRIKALRKTSGLTQKKVGELVGITEKAVQDHERGNIPTRKNLRKYARLYECDEAWLLTGRGEKRPGDKPPPTPIYKGKEAKGFMETRDNHGPFSSDRPPPEAEPQYLGGQFMEDINHLKVIYDYGDLEIINAIHSNLKTFNRTVQREIEVKELKQKVFYLERETAELHSTVNKLESAVEQLMGEQKAAQEKIKTGTDA